MKFFICLFIFLFSLKCVSQNSLSGKVVEKETNEALPQAIISLPDLKKSTLTDKEGKYKIENLPKGKFVVLVKYVSYTTQIREVEINGETKIDFEMVHSVTEFETIVVTGVSSVTEQRQNPVPAIAIPKERLLENSSTNIIDAVAKEPGISQITTGSGISKPVIRGLGYNRTLVLVNGIRQEGQQWGDEHGIEVDEFSVDRVEVIKGPGSLFYGSDAMAGVINLLSPYPPQEGKVLGTIYTNYQSNNNSFGWSAMNAGTLNGVHWDARITSKQAGNYSNRYDGKVFNSGWNEFNVNGNLGLIKKWGFSNLHISRFNQELGIPQGKRDSAGNFVKDVLIGDSIIIQEPVTETELNGKTLLNPKQNVRHIRVSSDNMFIVNKVRLYVNMGWQQNHRKEFEIHIPENSHGHSHNHGAEDEHPMQYMMLSTWNYDAKLFFPEAKGWNISTGINGMVQSHANKGEEFLIPEYNLTDAGGFLFARKSFGKIHFSGGTRYDYRIVHSKELLLDTLGKPTNEDNPFHKHKFQKFNADFSNVSGSAGISYLFKNDNVLKLNIARGFRAPNIAEMASNGHHHGALRYEIGNNALLPETSMQADAEVLFNTAHVSAKLGVFNNLVRKYIFIRKLSSVFGGDSLFISESDADTLPVFKFTQGNAQLHGGEIAIDIHPHPFDWLHFENSFSYVNALLKNSTDSTTYLPFTPAPMFSSELKMEFQKLKKNLRHSYFFIKTDVVLKQNKIYSAYGTETETPGYILLHLGIGSEMHVKEKKLFSFHVNVTNLTDVAYQNHLSRLKYAPENLITGRRGVFNMGRNISFKIVIPFELKNAMEEPIDAK